MNIVLDANIVISALMGSRANLTIITSHNHSFYTPSCIINEIKKYKVLICEKTGQTSEEFDESFDALLKFVKLLEYIEYEDFMDKARQAISHRDWKDADYLACALAVKADFIWTNDKDFVIQKLVAIKTTNEFIKSGKLS